MRLMLCVFALSFATAANAEVIVSEIMYNPRSSEQLPNKVEWIEIFNSGDAPVDLTAWKLRDEDGETQPIAAGQSIAPGEAVVLIPAEQSATNFAAAWGESVRAIALTGWNEELRGLSNDPGPGNEQLELVDATGGVADAVHFDDAGDWPAKTTTGCSIELVAGQLTAAANDDGKNWRATEPGVAGAAKCQAAFEFNGDVGSPGKVAAESATASHAETKSAP